MQRAQPERVCGAVLGLAGVLLDLHEQLQRLLAGGRYGCEVGRHLRVMVAGCAHKAVRVRQVVDDQLDYLAVESIGDPRGPDAYSQERNQRAGAEASPQKRGRIGRELRAELKEAASNGDD